MRALVVGWRERNIGDLSYNLAFPRALPDYDVEFAGRIRPEDDHDLFVLGGGEIVREAFTRHFTPDQLSRTIAASVGVTSDSDFEFLRACRRVLVRDLRSHARSLEQGVGAEYVPDAAFLLEPDVARGRAWLRESFEAEGRDLYSKVVCCVPNAYTFFGGHDARARDHQKSLAVAEDLALVCDNLDASVVFLPFGTQPPADDRVPASYINSRVKWHKKNLVVHERLDVQTTLDVVAACDSLVGNRLHALIFATIGGIPFVALDHHSKVGDYVREFPGDLSASSVPFYGFSRDSALSLIEGNISDGPSRTLLHYAEMARRSLLAVRLS